MMPPILMISYGHAAAFASVGRNFIIRTLCEGVGVTYIWAGYILGERNDRLISTDIVAGEPPPLTLYFTVPPSTGISIEDMNDLTGTKGQASGILLLGGKVVESQNKLGGGWLNTHGLVGRRADRTGHRT